MRVAPASAALLLSLLAAGPASAQTAGSPAGAPAGAMAMDGYVMGSGGESWSSRPGPMLMPIRMMMPGDWHSPGQWSVMGNASFIATNPGFARAENRELGTTHPYALNDWIMGRGRTSDGYVEGLLMLNLEPLTFTRSGWYEVGQSGEGLVDAQHQHQLLHQALLAVHLTGPSKGPFQATLWGGQGSASIGPPIFMHRASNPSPSVPRKHHKGENPHETFPVIGATVELGGAALDLSAFNAREPTREQSRLVPHPGVPRSVAARLRYTFARSVEAQISGERLVDQGDEGDAMQYSASVYGRYVGRFVVDALVDGAVDVPIGNHDEPGGASHGAATAQLIEVAVRDQSLRDVLWTRAERNDRVETSGSVSRGWLFGSLGYERLVWVDPGSVLAFGLFSEATLVRVPASVRPAYGDTFGVTTTLGLQVHLMVMPGMSHDMGAGSSHDMGGGSSHDMPGMSHDMGGAAGHEHGQGMEGGDHGGPAPGAEGGEHGGHQH